MPNGLEIGPQSVTQEQAQGYRGVRVDSTPLANYTVLGHQTNTATPESKGQTKRNAPAFHIDSPNWGT